jgi:MoaA/NifB/PqqE/SkfB family radical SAM enzyme
MNGLSIELTNVCNRHCLHCIRNKADPPEHLPLELLKRVLGQARDLGLMAISLTGGEVALYPHLEEVISLVMDHDFTFNLVTNSYRFRERLLPLLTVPKNREKLAAVCFSLDGARPETHDALRGPGSFREVIEAAAICKLEEIPFSLKSVITNFNKEELVALAMLGTALGTKEHGFLHPFPSPRLIREEVIPSPAELRRIVHWVTGTLAKALRTVITVEGTGPRKTLFTCPNIIQGVNLDFQGNLILCCNLSHVAHQDGIPTSFGRERLADLKEQSLQEGLIRHFHAHARLMEARLQEKDRLEDLRLDPCYWCFRHFGKLEWLCDFPESPWAAGVLENGGSQAYG